MQWSDVQRNVSSRTLRQFAGLCLLFFGGLAAWYGFVRGNPLVALTFLAAALAIGPLGLIRPRAIQPIYKGWMILVFPIGWLVSNLILACLFYGVITPVGLLFRMIGRDVLDRKCHPGVETFWRLKVAPTDVRSYFRQF